LQTEFAWVDPDGVALPEEVRTHLGLDAGAEVVVTPLPQPSVQGGGRARAKPLVTEA
jgi:hypothetical protein